VFIFEKELGDLMIRFLCSPIAEVRQIDGLLFPYACLLMCQQGTVCFLYLFFCAGEKDVDVLFDVV